MIDVGDGFWNIRGSFKIAAVVDIGTHASLVRLASGKYVLIDACKLDASTRAWVDELTNDGADLEAIINVHPFHTVFVSKLHAQYPNAKLIGTARHLKVSPELPWETVRSEDPELHAMYADDFEFSIPRGVDYIPANESLHFSSVLVFHPASKTLHVDDTLSYSKLPGPLGWLKPDITMLHPALSKVLHRRAGAAAEFRAWGDELVALGRRTDNLCAAHSAALLARDNDGESVAARIEKALHNVERKLAAHERKYG